MGTPEIGNVTEAWPAGIVTNVGAVATVESLLVIATVSAESFALAEFVFRVSVAVVPELSANEDEPRLRVSVGWFVSCSVAVSGIDR